MSNHLRDDDQTEGKRKQEQLECPVSPVRRNAKQPFDEIHNSIPPFKATNED